MNNEMAKITVAPYLAGIVNYATMKIIGEVYSFGTKTVDIFNDTDEDRLRIIRFTRKLPGYMHD